MSRADRLDVLHGDVRVGRLSRSERDALVLEYDDSWLREGFAISRSLPLISEPLPADGFFGNLLPEGEIRVLLARRLGVSHGNDFELLRAIGGDCAGALSLGELKSDVPPTSRDGDVYEELIERDLVAWMDEGLPLLSRAADRASTRLSLAGAQDKLPVHIGETGRVFLPQGARGEHAYPQVRQPALQASRRERVSHHALRRGAGARDLRRQRA